MPLIPLHFRRAGTILFAFAAVAIALAGCQSPNVKRAGLPATVAPEIASRLPNSKALAAFHFVDAHQRRISTELTFTNGPQLLKIEFVPDLGREGAKIMLDDGVMGVQALYANALSPYPGDISREVVTDTRYLPTLIRTNWNGRASAYALLYANDRFGYGAMAADAVRYRALVGWFYCEKTDVFYKVRCFLPLTSRREELEALFLSLDCP